MSVRTGNPRGRPKGARNKRTEKREREAKRAAEAIEAVIPEAFAGDAHAFLMTVYKDPMQPLANRLDAAKTAIRYELPTLSPVEQVRRGDEVIVPLAERLRAYAAEDAIEASERKAVKLKIHGPPRQ